VPMAGGHNFRKCPATSKNPIAASAGEMDWNADRPRSISIAAVSRARSKEIEEAKKLVDAMQNPKVDERVLALQTGKLKELIGRLAVDKTANQVRPAKPEVGGVFRGTAFPWRQFARAANFAPDRPV